MFLATPFATKFAFRVNLYLDRKGNAWEIFEGEDRQVFKSSNFGSSSNDFSFIFNKMSFDRILRINVRSATTMKSRICTEETRHADQITL